MGMLVAQEFEIMRREVDHQQPAARAQHPGRLADRAAAVVEEVQHLVDDDDVEGIRAAPTRSKMSPWRTLQFLMPGVVEPAAREGQHVDGRDRCRGRARSAAPNSSSMRPVPVPRSSSERNGRSPSSSADLGFDRLVGGMQAADAVPLGGVAAEIILRRRDAGRAHAGEPLAVAGDDGIGGIELFAPTGAPARPSAPCSARRKNAHDALAEALDQPRLGEQLEMARNARLRLAQDFGELRHGQFRLGEQREDAQPRLFPGRLERGIQVVEGDRVRSWWDRSQSEWSDMADNDIKISLC